METKPAQSRNDRFINWLTRLRSDPGAMASLRRGLGKPAGTVAVMHRYVQGFLKGEADELTRPSEDALYLVAALFAFWHQGRSPDQSFPAPPRSLGASLAPLVADSDGVEKRFVALLNCHSDDLPQHLRHAVALLKARDIPIDWSELLADIRTWDYESRNAQRRWAKGFWRAQHDEGDDDAAA